MNYLKKYWIENKIHIVTIVTVIMIIYQLFNLFFIFEITAQSNDECLWVVNKMDKNIVFQLVKEGGITWNAGIRDGDRLIAIDGVKVKSLQIASQVLDAVRAGDYATYTVERDGNVFETKIQVKKLINILGFAYWLLSFIWLIVGLVVVLAKPEGKIQQKFFRIGFLLVLFSSNNFLYRGLTTNNPLNNIPYLSLVILFFFIIGAVFSPFAMIDFFSNFPREVEYTKKKWYQRWLLVLPLFLFSITVITVIIGISKSAGDGYFNIIFNSLSIFVVIGFAAGFKLLYKNYRRIEGKDNRKPFFIIMVTYFIGFLAIVYNYMIANQVGGLIFNNPLLFTPIILIALLPIAFAYSIFRYSLMDMSDVLRYGILYGTASVTLAAIYFIIIYVAGQSISNAISEEYQGILAGAIFVIFATVFQSTKNKFQDVITQKFYPEQFAFQKVLLRFSIDVSSIVGFENIVEWTTNLFVSSLKLQHFGILLKDGKSNQYKLFRNFGLTNDELVINDEWGKINEFVIQQILSSKQTVLERNEFSNILGKESEKLVEENIFTIIPLIVKSKVIGLLLFGLKLSGSQFAGKDLELLLSAANQTSTALENARLYESELEKQKLERDLENARKIQQTLLPREIPKIERLEVSGMMIPAQHIGGDYYDIIKVSDDEIFAIVGDVSGKGLSASLYMSKLQTMVRLYCIAGKSPCEILKEINKRLFSDLEKNYFITVTLALFNTKIKKSVICRAGHTPIYIVSKGVVESIQPNGMALGLDKGEIFNSSLHQFEYEIKNGDLFFIYSDGVTEAMNKDGEEFGEKRLRSYLQKYNSDTVLNINNQLLTELENYSGDTPQHDDIAILCIKYCE